MEDSGGYYLMVCFICGAPKKDPSGFGPCINGHSMLDEVNFAVNECKRRAASKMGARNL